MATIGRNLRIPACLTALAGLALLAAWAGERYAVPYLLGHVHPAQVGDVLRQSLAVRLLALRLFAVLALALAVAGRFLPLDRWRTGALVGLLLAAAFAARWTTPDMALDFAPRPDAVHLNAVAIRLLTDATLTVPTGAWVLPARTLPGASFWMCLTQGLQPAAFGWGIGAIFLAAVLSAALAWALARRLFSPAAGAAAALLIALSPMHAFYSRMLMSEIPWSLLVPAALYLWLAFPERRLAAFAGGLLLGLGLLFKSAHLLIVLGALLAVAGAVIRRRTDAIPCWRLFVLGAVIGSLPGWFYNRFALGGWWRTPYHLYWPDWSAPAAALNVKYLWHPPIIDGRLGNAPYYLLAALGLDPRPERMPWALPVVALLIAALALKIRPAPANARGRFLLTLAAWIAALYGGACLFYSFQHPRLFLPLLPLGAIAAAPPLAELFRRLAPAARNFLLATALALVLAFGLAIAAVETAGARQHERLTLARLTRAAADFDALVTDEDPVLLTCFGVWTPRTQLVPLLREGEVWFPENPEFTLRAEGVAVKPYGGTLQAVRALLAGGKRIGVWIRKPHYRPQAHREFRAAFATAPQPAYGVPGFEALVTAADAAAPSIPAAGARAPAAAPVSTAPRATSTAAPSSAPEKAGAAEIPAHTFTLGGEAPPFAEGRSRALPEHRVTLSAFALDRRETDTRFFAAFLNDEWGRRRLHIVDTAGVVSVYAVLTNGLSPVLCRIDRAGVETHLVCDAGNAAAPFAPAARQGVDYGAHPMVGVSWFGAAAFCNWRSAREGLAPLYGMTTNADCSFAANAAGYRLPTEAEWESAAAWDAAGRKRIYAYGDRWDPARAHSADSEWTAAEGAGPATVPVAAHGAADARADGRSAGGLENMTGNVWEWCHDWYGPYSADDQRDPLGPATGSVKAVRGGSYRSGSEISWCAFRGLCDPVLCRPDIGFRAARAGKREE